MMCGNKILLARKQKPSCCGNKAERSISKLLVPRDLKASSRVGVEVPPDIGEVVLENTAGC